MNDTRKAALCPDADEATRHPHPPPPDPSTTREIVLTRGRRAIVDACDYPTLSRYSWRYSNGRAARSINFLDPHGKWRNRSVYMHRSILNAPTEMEVDHINGDALDNRRCNLRLATRQENQMNKGAMYRARCRYVGVSPEGSRFVAHIMHKGRRYRIGAFDTDIEAARARDVKALELCGEFARLNFPDEVTP